MSVAPPENHCTLAGVSLSVIRLDLLDPHGTGNKHFKLRDSLQQAAAQGYKRLISFGGAYSNHIHALALAGREQGFDTVGVIRGEPASRLNATLGDAVDAGMQLHFISRQQYRRRNEAGFRRELGQRFPGCYWIPEGGSSLLGVRGCMAIADFIDPAVDLIVLPCGTAATLAGVAAASPDRQVMGISVLKNALDLDGNVRQYLADLRDAGYIDQVPANWSINHDYHCGGYARGSRELAAFLQQFERETGIPIEPVYSGKMFYAMYQMLLRGDISPTTRIAAIHTGGLQGLRGMQARLNSAGSDTWPTGGLATVAER